MTESPGREIVAPEAFDWIADHGGNGNFMVFDAMSQIELLVSATEERGVARAAADLASDLKRLSGRPFAIRSELPPGPSPGVLIAGTEAGNGHIADLARRGYLNLEPIRGCWESCLVATIPTEALGLPVLAIVGSDRRGVIFALYALAEQWGVSPWHWWSSTAVKPLKAAWVRAGIHHMASPRVKYRGIFLNDEYPNLTRWVEHVWGRVEESADPPIPRGVARYGREFYGKIFELMLRLRANYLWPAMWNNAFNEDDPANAALADEYGIIMGTSHQEPMLRAQKEWDRRHGTTLGHWDWLKHRGELEDFWRQGLRRNRSFESMVTIGLRGADDSEMSSAPLDDCKGMLEDIVLVQRRIIAEEYGQAAEEVPQLWCLYKEVLEYYHRGLEVPDDVTLLWSDDNWGNLRRVPSPEERSRRGGSGVYYHLDYHGGPRSYQWLNTTALVKILDQMELAARYGADRVWIVNVGHLKGYEQPLEFFLNLAWNPDRWLHGGTEKFSSLWAEREFGSGQAACISQIMADCARYNSRRKPELLAPGTWSFVNYNESARVQSEWDRLEAQAEDCLALLGDDSKESFYQTVGFPIKASALVYRLYRAAGLNRLYARQGRVSALFQAALARSIFQADLELMDWYNHSFAGGRWCHFMDQPHLGYVSWNDPPANSLDAIVLEDVVVEQGKKPGLALEGQEAAWPVGSPSLELEFDSSLRQSRWIEVFRRGEDCFYCQLHPEEPWIVPESRYITVGSDRRIQIDIDWRSLSPGLHRGRLIVVLDRETLVIAIRAHCTAPDKRRGFLSGDGLVSIHAPHFQHHVQSTAGSWQVFRGYGNDGDAVRTVGLIGAEPFLSGHDAPALGYDFHVPESPQAVLYLVLGPSLNVVPGQGLSLGWSLDEGPITVLETVPANYIAQHHNLDWERTVADNRRTIMVVLGPLSSGWHRLWLRMTVANLIVQKLIIDIGGLKPSYLGPPESYFIGEEHL